MAIRPFNPKSTVFTNDMLDIIMPRVSPNAWKILCLAMRKTAGWADASTYSGRKESDVISLSQFMQGCGIKSETTVREAITECIDEGYLVREPGGAYGQSFCYSLNTEYEIQDTPTESDGGTPTENGGETPTESGETNSNNINSNKDTRDEEIKQSNREALLKGMTRHNTRCAESYPEDVKETLLVFSELWNIDIPRTKNQRAFWIESARELREACGEFGVSTLRKVRKSCENYMNLHGGVSPYTVSSPRSLVNPARAEAACMRIEADNIQKKECGEFTYALPGAAEVWVGGERYVR